MALLETFLLEGVRLNFWVATRGDGITGCGSQADPFNASSRQFDAVMVKILATPEAQAAPITVYLGPGVFETKGYRTDNETSLSGWQPKAGMKIICSGIEVTTIKLINATVADAHYCALGHAVSAGAQRVGRRALGRAAQLELTRQSRRGSERLIRPELPAEPCGHILRRTEKSGYASRIRPAILRACRIGSATT